MGQSYAITEKVAPDEIAFLGIRTDKKYCSEIPKKTKMTSWQHAFTAHEEEAQQYRKEKKVDCSTRCGFRMTRQGDTNHNHHQVTNHVHRWREKGHNIPGNLSGQIFVRPEHST